MVNIFQFYFNFGLIWLLSAFKFSCYILYFNLKKGDKRWQKHFLMCFKYGNFIIIYRTSFYTLLHAESQNKIFHQLLWIFGFWVVYSYFFFYHAIALSVEKWHKNIAAGLENYKMYLFLDPLDSKEILSVQITFLSRKVNFNTNFLLYLSYSSIYWPNCRCNENSLDLDQFVAHDLHIIRKDALTRWVHYFP